MQRHLEATTSDFIVAECKCSSRPALTISTPRQPSSPLATNTKASASTPQPLQPAPVRAHLHRHQGWDVTALQYQQSQVRSTLYALMLSRCQPQVSQQRVHHPDLHLIRPARQDTPLRSRSVEASEHLKRLRVRYRLRAFLSGGPTPRGHGVRIWYQPCISTAGEGTVRSVMRQSAI